MKLNDEDLNDIAEIAKELKDLCVIKERNEKQKEELLENIKGCVSAISEIVQGPKGTVLRMF